jgi:hypothetical protein
MGSKPTTNNETKDSNNPGLKWAPQALRPLVSSILSIVSYKKNWGEQTPQKGSASLDLKNKRS